jgi:hypothetical protein
MHEAKKPKILVVMGGDNPEIGSTLIRDFLNRAGYDTQLSVLADTKATEKMPHVDEVLAKGEQYAGAFLMEPSVVKGPAHTYLLDRLQHIDASLETLPERTRVRPREIHIDHPDPVQRSLAIGRAARAEEDFAKAVRDAEQGRLKEARQLTEDALLSNHPTQKGEQVISTLRERFPEMVIAVGGAFPGKTSAFIAAGATLVSHSGETDARTNPWGLTSFVEALNGNYQAISGGAKQLLASGPKRPGERTIEGGSLPSH